MTQRETTATPQDGVFPSGDGTTPIDAPTKHDGWFFWVRRGLSLGLLGLVVIVALAAVVVPLVTGSQTYTIAGGSMEPRLPLGSLVVVQDVDPSDIALGDVITFQLASGQPTVATHRVVGFEDAAGGERRYITKGDANGSEDGSPVRVEQLRGRVWYSIPLLGYVNAVVSGSTRAVVVPLAAAALLGYGAWMIISGLRARRRQPSASG
ncbi:signal peptidase I [Plantibacter flavus]|uniref:signal peptidase I n=1 Tax=Plantibacter flavus TaxID=150123 RepID=UPI003F160455